MAAKSAAQTFKKYTVQPTGIWARVSSILNVDPGRSTGVPLNPQFRNPPPGANDPKKYDDPVTLPAADIADNPYWKRDTRRNYPRLSVMNQGDVVALLSVGSQSNPKDDVLQLGEAGTKQIVAVKEEGQKGLAAYFEKDKKSIAEVLGPTGLPPSPKNLGQNAKPSEYAMNEEQTYGSGYPCRTFS